MSATTNVAVESTDVGTHGEPNHRAPGSVDQLTEQLRDRFPKGERVIVLREAAPILADGAHVVFRRPELPKGETGRIVGRAVNGMYTVQSAATGGLYAVAPGDLTEVIMPPVGVRRYTPS